jgi:hypothetical protein
VSYSPAHCPLGGSLASADNHEKVTIHVIDANGQPIETVTRTVMSNDGKRYVIYKHKQRQIKKMKLLGDSNMQLRLITKE